MSTDQKPNKILLNNRALIIYFYLTPALIRKINASIVQSIIALSSASTMTLTNASSPMVEPELDLYHSFQPQYSSNQLANADLSTHLDQHHANSLDAADMDRSIGKTHSRAEQTLA